MNIGITAMRTKNTKLNRYELIKDLQTNNNKIFYIGQQSGHKIHDDYQKYDVEYLSIPIVRDNINPLKELKALFEVSRILKKSSLDSILIYGIRTFPAMVLAAKFAGIKKIVCIVNGSGRLFRMNGFKGQFIKILSYPMIALALNIANHIFVQNEDDKNMLVEKKLITRKNYSVINGSGVNLNDYQMNDLPTQDVFTFIGRITGDKGINELLSASSKVKGKYPNVKINIIGQMDDSDNSVDKKLFSKSINDSIVNYIGYVEDVKGYLLKTRYFVLPSYYEGTPRTILEAMALGRPIITTDVPGCRQTIEEGINGFTVPPKNSEELAKKMIWMIENPVKVKKMGLESRKICEKKYDVNMINKEIVDKLLREEDDHEFK